MKKSLFAVATVSAAVWSLQAQGAIPGERQGTPEAQAHWTSPSQMRGSALLSTTSLTNAPVVARSGEEIGELADVLFDPASGRVDFALVKLNPALLEKMQAAQNSGASGTPIAAPSATRPQKLVAVPWRLLHMPRRGPKPANYTSGEKASFLFTGSVKKLEGAPGFDAAMNLSRPEWREQMFTYYGLAPKPALGGANAPSGVSSGASAASAVNAPPKEVRKP